MYKNLTHLDKTIAVLPFVNMSSNAENEFFTDGITEEIINILAQIEGLKVTSRTSSFYFKGKNVPIPQIGEKLGVSIILEGSIRLSGNFMRITAQLIDAREDFHFWSETWDRELTNIFEVQDEISFLIAERLREHFGHFEINHPNHHHERNSVDAHKLFLKARRTFNKWNPDDVKQSMLDYEKVLEIEPNHVEAMVGLADAYSFLATISVIPFNEGWGICEELTKKALRINDKLPGAYCQLANFVFFTECDYRKAFEYATHAAKLSENHVETQHFLAFLYILAGREKESRNHLNNALIIDPLSQETQFFNGFIEYMSENYHTALEQLNSCLEVNPYNIPVHSVKTLCLLRMGQYDDAINYFDSLPSQIIVAGEKAGSQAIGYALKEDKLNADKSKDILIKLSQGEEGFTANSYLFLLAGATGNISEALDWSEKALKLKSPLLHLRFSDPLVNSIKNSERYLLLHDQLFPKDLFIPEPNPTNKKPLLSNEDVAKYKLKLQAFIDKEKPFLSPELSLPGLASRLDLNANQLSWLLNDGFGKNFNEFINHYRIKEFQRIAIRNENAHLTIMALAYDCGFNSKSVFNTYFKKETGITPKQFLSKHSS